MSNKLFSKEEIEILSKNKYVKSVSERAITYSNDFKLLFISKYKAGLLPSQIFKESGFNINILGYKRIKCASERWRKAYNKNGELGLEDGRKFTSGRSLKRELNTEEIIAKKDAEIAYWKAQVELLKKLELQERQVKKGKINAANIYKTIKEIILKYKFKNMVSFLCNISNVSKSGYYKYLKSLDKKLRKEEKELKLKELILKAFSHRGYKKGSRTIKMVLEKDFNLIINRKCIQRIMRKYNIECPYRKANPYRRMMKANKEHRVVPNILNRNFKQGSVGKVLLTDITYLQYGKSSMAYLSTIKDGMTNEILSYNLSNSLKIKIVTKTIENLLNKHKEMLHKNAFIHSDQGVHYTSPIFQKLLKENNLGQSMSRKGNCWDNAPQESFFGHMKDEINIKGCTTFKELKQLIDDYIFYYNNYRYQWGLKKLTPIQYRNQLLNK